MNRRKFIASGIAGMIAAQKAFSIIPFSFRNFSPLSIGSCQQWCQATLVDGSNNAINKGSGSNLTNASVSIVSNVVSGYPVFRFNGTSSRFTYTSITAGTTFSAFALLKCTSSVTAAAMLTWVNAAATNQLLSGAAGPQLACFSGASNYPKSSTIDFYTNFSLVGVVCTAGTCVFYQNGSSVGTGAQTVGSITVVDFGAATSFFGTFDCAEMFLYTSAMTSGQISALTEYCRQKYKF